MSEQQQAATAAGVAAATIDRLARIETKLDGMSETRDQLTKHAARLDRLERFMWLAVGMSFASGVPALLEAVGAGGGGAS